MRVGRKLIAGALGLMLIAGGAVAGITATRTPTPAEANMAPLREALASGEPITVLGLGSSVGNGVGLEHPETDAPVAHLAALLSKKYPDADIEFTNRSVDGSDAFYLMRKFGQAPDFDFPTVVLFTFGMNEGGAYAYNAGSTYPMNKAALAALAAMYLDGGSTVLMATTPSPHTGRMPWRIAADQTITYPEGATTLEPAPEDSLTEIDGVPFSVRHARFNEDALELAARAGYAPIDVVPAWVDAVRELGEARLYDADQINHPNLLGHQSSYWPALEAFVEGL